MSLSLDVDFYVDMVLFPPFLQHFKDVVPLSSGLHYFSDEYSVFQIILPLYAMCHCSLTVFKIFLIV